MNIMQQVDIEKITLNIGVGNQQDKLNKSIKLLQTITNAKPIKTLAKRRIPGWDIRPGLPIGCKVTLRRKKAKELLKKLLQAIDNSLKSSQFDNKGNLSFGIEEYINIPDVKYDLEIGIIGLEVAVTFKKHGLRVKKRKIKQNKIPLRHMVSKEEAINYMQTNFNTKINGAEK